MTPEQSPVGLSGAIPNRIPPCYDDDGLGLTQPVIQRLLQLANHATCRLAAEQTVYLSSHRCGKLVMHEGEHDLDGLTRLLLCDASLLG